MPHQSYKPGTKAGIGLMLVTFDTAIRADGGALATRYGVTADELTRVHQGRLVWDWFEDAMAIARGWTTSLTQSRGLLSSPDTGDTDPLPGVPSLPPVPVLVPGPPVVPALIDHGFFAFFGDLVARIKHTAHYDKADGKLLGIEGADQAPPNPAIVPELHGEIFTGGQPELTCVKSVFQGYDVYVTLPGKPRQLLDFSTSRRYLVTKLPLPAPGTAEVWVFQVQYRYQDKPFGQFSQPLSLTVRG